MDNENKTNETNTSVVPNTVNPVGGVVPNTVNPVGEVTPASNDVPASSEAVPTATPAENNTQTIVVPSQFPDETPASAVAPSADASMPAIVNPLEVKKEEEKPVAAPAPVAAPNPDEVVVSKEPSEFAKKLQAAQDNYKPPSRVHMFFTVFLFIALIVFVIFLPDIASFINIKKNAQPVPEGDPTTGILICTLENNTSNLDKTFKREFSYEDNKLKSAVIETTTRGDASLDGEMLDDMYHKCMSISTGVEGVEGITVVCEYKEGLLTERERFDYATYNLELINAAYAEAGSSVLEFDYDADIDNIMKSMRQAGFTCNKEKK